MFINYLSTNPQFFWAVCITVVVSICVHELCHGFAAIWLGDRTPIETGHMTLNPVKHMGVYSLILLLTAGIAWGAMPITPSRLRGWHARAIVAFAGPLSNVIMASVALVGLGLWIRGDIVWSQMHHSPITLAYLNSTEKPRYFMRVFGIMNISLAIFNLLPVPPLDGSKVLADFSPPYSEMIAKMRQNGQSMIGFMIIFFFAGQYIIKAAATIGEYMIRLGIRL